MCQIKAIFWDETDCVVQYHPPRSEYVNNHPNCLHLWRPTEATMPMPPSIMVGFKEPDPITSYYTDRANGAHAAKAP